MVVTSLIRQVFASTSRMNNKFGWGPYRMYRKNSHIVGTEPSVVKYHVIPDKTPSQPYGLQGKTYLQPMKGKVYKKLPTRVNMIKDKVYTWCSCGYSGNQPLCDGTHNTCYIPKQFQSMKPIRFIPDKDMEVWLCNCKQTNNRPFCDGSHRLIKEKGQTGDEDDEES